MGLILLVAELGGGFGHVRRLLPVAHAVRARGHRAVFLVPNPEEVSSFVIGEGFELAALPFEPRMVHTTAPQAVAATFGDILAQAGFIDPERLAARVRAWDLHLAALAPLAVVCEHSPFLCLANYNGGLPLVVLGHGFVLPPPSLPRFPKLWGADPLYSEAQLLENAARVCNQRGRGAPHSLPEIFSGTRHAVTGLCVLDPYRKQRVDVAVGPLALDVAFEPGSGDEIFLYLLGDAPQTLDLLRAASHSRLRGDVFVRRPTPQHGEILNGSRLRLLDRPTSIRDAMQRARLVVHHGSMAMSEEALASGRPQVVAPIYLEHLLTARALVGLGVARVARSIRDIEQTAQLLATTGDEQTTTAAAEFAERYWDGGGPSQDLADQLLTQVGVA